jgi:hypothetical protein
MDRKSARVSYSTIRPFNFVEYIRSSIIKIFQHPCQTMPRHNAVISAYTANTATDLVKVGDGASVSLVGFVQDWATFKTA